MYQDSYDTAVVDNHTGVEVSVYVYVSVPDGWHLRAGALERVAETAAERLLDDEVTDE